MNSTVPNVHENWEFSSWDANGKLMFVCRDLLSGPVSAAFLKGDLSSLGRPWSRTSQMLISQTQISKEFSLTRQIPQPERIAEIY